MSAITVDNPITIFLRQTLNDYDLRLIGSENDTLNQVTAPNLRRTSSFTTQNPPSWPRNYHRVPDRRPLNRDLVFAERPGGSNIPEGVFITVMFTGVALNTGVAQLWSMTGGKVFEGLFSYSIGGEW
ncbi:hypothetical protein VTL71DRAFT_2247 [Oculimacula yallundae]|uniref:Uncharacterized protein n=1 Tax=Oculimacula yallundae TaxID=86028 RepID=A0ABR4C8C0_9HELO